MAGIKFDGFDDLIDELEQLAQNARELDGEHEVPLFELFTQSFMEENTHYSSLAVCWKLAASMLIAQKRSTPSPNQNWMHTLQGQPNSTRGNPCLKKQLVSMSPGS